MNRSSPTTRTPHGVGFPSFLVAWTVLATLFAPSTPPAAGQEAPGVLNGRVLMAGQGVSDVMVTLHRVTMEESGEVDSLSTGPDGDFTFVLPSLPTATGGHEVYFASVLVDDVLYFGSPVSNVEELGSLYIIDAFPTRAVGETPPPLPVDDRSFIVEGDGQGGWLVTDIFNVLNDGEETWTSVEGRAVWSYPLPEGAAGIRVGQSDLAPDAVSFDGGRITVTSPIPPGKRNYMIQYALPDLGISLDLPGQVNQLSVLVREPGPALTLEGLVPQPPVELQPGAVFRHFLGMDLTDATVTMTMGPSSPTSRIGVEWLVVLVSFVMGGAAILAYQRGRFRAAASVAAAVGGRRTREDVLGEIAQLDEVFHRTPDPSEADRELYERRRAVLKAELLGGVD